VTALVLDAGALIAFERGERKIEVLVRQALHRSAAIVVPAGVVAQVWRDGRKQARLARLLAKPEVSVIALDDMTARACGQLCGLRHTSDIVDASVAICARARKAPVATSDREDLAQLDPTLELIEI
jgi:hypothetical protein